MILMFVKCFITIIIQHVLHMSYHVLRLLNKQIQVGVWLSCREAGKLWIPFIMDINMSSVKTSRTLCKPEVGFIYTPQLTMLT